MKESIEKCSEFPAALVIGGSAGSVRFLLSLAPALPAGLNFPILLVVHRMRNEESLLGGILNSRLGLEVKEAEEKDEIRPGVMYVAPTNYHVLVEEDRTVTLEDTEHVKHSRPSIDVTMVSAADTFRERTVGILLSGANDDGTDGLRAIVAAGGRAIAQDPREAQFEAMPQYAISAIDECEVMGRDELLRLFQGWCGQPDPLGAPGERSVRQRGLGVVGMDGAGPGVDR